MENQENSQENQNLNEDKKHIITWKVFFIILGVSCFIFLSYFTLKFCNSDWLMTKTMPFKSIKESKLGNNLTYQYSTRYSHRHLIIDLTINNIDEKIMDIVPDILSDYESLITLNLLDKKGNKILEIRTPVIEFKKASNKINGAYRFKKSIKMDKKFIKQIKTAQPEYQQILDYKYDDIANKSLFIKK